MTREELQAVLAPFYKTIDVMKSAYEGDKSMVIWGDDIKAVDDVMLFLEKLRDGGVAQTPGCNLVTGERDNQETDDTYFHHAQASWRPIETAPKDQEVEVRGIWKLRGDGVVFTHWRPTP